MLSTSRWGFVEGLILGFFSLLKGSHLGYSVVVTEPCCAQGKKWRGGVNWFLEERCRCCIHWAWLVVVTELGQSSGTGLAGRMWWLGRLDAGLTSWWAGVAVPSRILLFCFTVSVILVQFQYLSSLHAGAIYWVWCGLCVEDYLIRLFYWFCCLTFLRKYYLSDCDIWGQLQKPVWDLITHCCWNEVVLHSLSFIPVFALSFCRLFLVSLLSLCAS